MATKTHITQADSLPTRHAATLSELERYRLLVESVQDYAIFLLDTEGNVISWNKGAEKNKGYTASEIIGKHFSTFYLPHDVAARKPQRELELAKRFGRVEDEDWRLRKDGSQFWANVVITTLYDDDGKFVGFAKVTRDLTERKQHEDKLRHANVLLKKQQRELEQLNNLKDEFISLASHQLRTPATSIKQYLGMIIEGFIGEPSPEQLQYVQKAYDNNQRQIAIVNDLLKVAQIDAGKVHLHKNAIELPQLLASIAEDQMDRFTHHGQRVEVVVSDESLPSIFVDLTHFRMALDNLVDNASKYTPRGGTITLSASCKGTMAKISIKDTGVGIAPEDQAKLFHKFVRIPNRMSDDVGGSGLGLYWVSKVVELHGGHIKVQSKLNEGTQFDVYVPIGDVSA